jgi:hypothetical protein
MKATMKAGALLALLLAAVPKRAEAFPPKLVHDRLWSQSAPWIVVNNAATAARGVRQIRVTQTEPRCSDPLSRTDTGMAPLCLGEAPARSVWVHFIDEATGRESRDPIEFTAAMQASVVTLPAGRQLLFVHQGATARGAVTVRVELLNQFRQPIQPQFIPSLGAGRTDFDLSGDVFLDVAGAPENFDVETPLQPDGPSALDPVLGTPVPGRDGNVANDYLGVDATEVWAFDANMRILTADRAHGGVASAGTLTSVRALRPLGVAARFVLARPFVAGA